jgi:hypothetical protein
LKAREFWYSLAERAALNDEVGDVEAARGL